MNLINLLRFGFFPKELPPPFSTNEFANFVDRQGVVRGIPVNYTSRPCIHNLARPGNQRRVLSVLNPFNFYKISKLLSEHGPDIVRQFQRSTLSLTKPIMDSTGKRAYKPGVSSDDVLMKRAEVRSTSKFILKTDISRFYSSIYTHSIPWAMKGKVWSKAHKFGGFSNDLDKFSRNAQDAQTLGLPVGPDTSYIISELIGAAIDEKIQALNWKGFRFVDDFEFGFLTRSEGEQALARLENILADFELEINNLKTTLEELPVFLDQPWRVSVKNFDVPNFPNVTVLSDYFSLLFELYKSNRSEPILRYGLARLRSVEFEDTDLLVDLLFQCVLTEPNTLKESLLLIQRCEIDVPYPKLSLLIETIISMHAPMKHGTEVAWALWAAILYEIEISDQALQQLKNFDDCVVALLSLHAHSKGLVSNEVLDIWKQFMTRQSLTDGHWLLAYEADLKGWLDSNDAHNHIAADPLFSVLKENAISFYDVSEPEIEEDSGDYGIDEDENAGIDMEDDDDL